MTPDIDRSSERDEAVNRVLVAYLEALEGGQAPNREAFLASHPEVAAELTEFFTAQDQFDRLAGPLDALTGERRQPAAPGAPADSQALKQTAALPSLAPAAVAPLESFGDYEILSELARGGMGVVYQARQRSLNRIVALKMIRAGRLASPRDVQRFRAEAEAAARLDHPNIVPIYEIGEHAGEPYFSMKLIEGGSLAAQQPGLSLNPRRCARLLATVARALHHAHQRGLLHRDLKPANILTDSADTPYITDFGLAKLLDRDVALTSSGNIVGTPRYLAPEQARGNNVPTTAVDVYGLGVVLYESLTGQPPFTAATPVEVMLLVVEAEPDKPRALNPRVPADLETICLKCLEKDPNKRYRSAEALADELDRFLAGEPIQARYTGTLGKLSRWCRRQPVVAALSAGLVAVVLGALVVVTVLWQRADANYLEKEDQRQRAERHYEQAEQHRLQAEQHLAEVRRQRAEADKSFQLAHRAINRFAIDLSEQRLVNVPGLQPLRKELLESALGYYEEFIKQRGTDPHLRGELAATYSRMAWVASQLGKKKEAAGAYQQAIALYRQLLADRPEGIEPAAVRADLGRTYNRLGILHSELGDPAEAASYQQAHALFQELLQDDPDNSTYLSDRAAVFMNQGSMHGAAGRLDEAEACYRQQLAIMEQLVRLHPRDGRFQRDLSLGTRFLATLAHERGRHTEALAYYAQARDRMEKLVRDQGGVLLYQFDLARICQLQGREQRLNNQPAAALLSLQRAHDVLDRLTRESPTVPQYQANLAEVHRDLAQLQQSAKELPKATASFQEARLVLERLVRQFPEIPAHQVELAGVLAELVRLLPQTGQRKEALECAQRARDLCTQLVKARPEDQDYRTELGMAHLRFGQCCWALSRRDEALTAVRQAVESQRAVHRQTPANARYRANLSFCLRAAAELEGRSGQIAEAAAKNVEFRKLWPDSAAQQYEAARELALLASYVGKDKPELTAEEQTERDGYAKLSLEALREALRLGFKDAQRLEKDTYFNVLKDSKELQAIVTALQKK